jgi:hypothetical protein
VRVDSGNQWVTGGVWVALVLALLCSSCQAEKKEPPKPVDVVVVDFHDWIKDGGSSSWALQPGRYKLEMTASGDGASIEWVGCTCPGSKAATTGYSVICDMPQLGQLIVTNPTSFGTGPSVSATVKVTKLAVAQ